MEQTDREVEASQAKHSRSMAPSQPSVNAGNKEEQNFFLPALETIGQPNLNMALDAIIKVGVFDLLAEAGSGRKLSAKEITTQLRLVNANMVDAFLGFLACYGLVDCSLSPATGERLYSFNAMSRFFVPDQAGVSLRPWLALTLDRPYLESTSEVKRAIVEGGVPFEWAHGMPTYEYMSKDERFKKLFHSVMTNNATLVLNTLLEAYDGFKGLKTLVDVGGGSGVTLNVITSKYPSLRGINFDLPYVIQQAPSYTGVEHIAGDFLEGIPKGDAIILQRILHNWSDDKCVDLLTKCYDAIPDGGKVIVMENIFHDTPGTSNTAKVSFLLNMIMSLLFPQGHERTHEEYKALAAKAGFSGATTFQDFTDCNYCVIEFFK